MSVRNQRFQQTDPAGVEVTDVWTTVLDTTINQGQSAVNANLTPLSNTRYIGSFITNLSSDNSVTVRVQGTPLVKLNIGGVNNYVEADWYSIRAEDITLTPGQNDYIINSNIIKGMRIQAQTDTAGLTANVEIKQLSRQQI